MNTRRPLLKVEEAAKELGVPKAGLRTAAEKLGLLIYMGRSPRIDPNNYEELIKGCQGKPLEQGSTCEKTRASSSSETPDTPTNQQAREIAAMLKKGLRPTSPAKAPSQAHVHRIDSQ